MVQRTKPKLKAKVHNENPTRTEEEKEREENVCNAAAKCKIRDTYQHTKPANRDENNAIAQAPTTTTIKIIK